ncbi:MAG: hypothetical protein FWC41_00485 [Firmicutes bacterium]|nr:hypothetical protein [Bacillota bacterium]
MEVFKIDNFNFRDGFNVYLDGQLLSDVYALQISVNREQDSEFDKNKITVAYRINGHEALISAKLGAISFGRT